jgi:hypothetical protein
MEACIELSMKACIELSMEAYMEAYMELRIKLRMHWSRKSSLRGAGYGVGGSI